MKKLGSGGNVWLVLVASILFGLAILLVSPILTKNVKFLVALPFAAMILMVMVLNLNLMFVLILLSRDFLDPILAGTKIGGGGGIGGVLNLFVIVMILVTVLKRPSVLKGNRFVVSWLIFLGCAGFTVLYAPLPGSSFKLLLNLTTYLAMFIAPFYLVKSEIDKKFWIKLILIASLVPVGFANLGLVYKHPMLYSYERLQSTFTHSNILAFYIVLVVVLTFYVLRTRVFRISGAMRLGLWLYMADLLLILIVTQTRSAWISFAILMVLYGVMKERKILLFCLIGGMALFALPQVQERMKDLQEGTGVTSHEKLNSFAWRLKLWESAIPSIQKKALTGHGLGSFEFLSKDFFPLEKKGAPAHNVYVELLFETGLLGVSAFIWIYLLLLKELHRRYKRFKGDDSKEALLTFSYIIGYLLVCFSDNALYYLAFNWYFWFFVGLIIRCGEFTEKRA